MTSSCPVSGKTAADGHSASSDGIAQCPFAPAAAQVQPASENHGAGAADYSLGPTCPYGFGSRPGGEAASRMGGAVCPMGFGSATPEDPLAALQCTRCKGLFYDAVKIACGHFFCRSCISDVEDCLLCGADVQGMQPEPRLQELVDLYLKVCGNTRAFEATAALPKGTVTHGHLQGANGQEASSPSGNSTCAEFLEQEALRSLAGGNVAAALDRLGLCRDTLLEAASTAGHTPDLCYRLGTVIGTQGTLLEQQGQIDAASEAYKKSIWELKRSPEASPEVVQALAVSLNKLGDRQYLDKDVRGALKNYKEALRVRQESSKNVEQASAEVQLGIVTSLLKVVDIEQAMDERAAAEERKEVARTMLCKVESIVPQQGPLRAKYLGLQAFLHQVG